MIGKLNPVSGWLLGIAVAAVLWAGVATYFAITAKARCTARIATEKGEAEAKAREHYRVAMGVALSIFDGTRADTAADLADAAGSTQGRGVQIVRVPVTGACVMPKGLPSLAPAVKEARDAAAD